MMLRKSTPALEGALNVSKMLKLPALLDADELSALFEALPPFSLYHTSGMCTPSEAEIPKEKFLARYAAYIEELKKGKLPEVERTLFSPIMTTTPDVLWALDVDAEHVLVKARLPVVQLQAHAMHYSIHDGAFRSLVFGSDSIPWGLHFSYPQLYQHPKTQEIQPVGSDFPNTELFKAVQRWVRHHTAATPFIIDGEQVNIPIRLGKKCFEWINTHPGLQTRGLLVARK